MVLARAGAVPFLSPRVARRRNTLSEAKREKGKSGKGTASDRHTDVHLADAVEILHKRMTDAPCQEVYGDVQDSEREKKWTFYALSWFCLGVIIEAPRSLSELLERTRRGEHEGFLTPVAASSEAFFQKCKNFSHVFFEQLHLRFIDDLKVVLNLWRFHAANPNTVAMQVYAAAIVHAAFRFPQAKIAKDAEIPQEEISTQKLFPLLAYVSMRLIEGGWYFDQTCEANPKVNLRKPSFRDMPGTVVSLKYIRRQRRSGPRWSSKEATIRSKTPNVEVT
jgi:hypothetical protein